MSDKRIITGEEVRIKPCCLLEQNLEFRQLRPDLSVKICRVCGCRHWRLKADPGTLNLRGKING